MVENKLGKPISPSAFMRGLRPEYYSDTEDRTTIVLGREVLENHLATITNRNETQDFELFCRKLCERTLCPNLRPATGPHGGGDSKADTETIPVSEEISALWYVGDQNAAKERWAFAFSAKKTWAAKVKSDVDGLIARNRGYRKIICVTSQYAPDKARARLEDDLTKQHGLTITILDRSWIIKETIENDRKDIAFDYLRVGQETNDTRRLGPRDYSRVARLEALEREIADTDAFDGIERQRVSAALVAAKLSRSLAKPRIETEGRFQRAIRLAAAQGTYRQKLEAHYESIWTAFWWFDDVALVNQSYESFEQLVAPSDHARDLEFLSTLLQLLFNAAMDGHMTAEECGIAARADRAERRFREVVDQPDRPNNSSEMRVLLIILALNRAMLARNQQNLSALWIEFSTLLDEASGLSEFDATRVVKFIEVAGQVAGNDPNYERLVDQVAEFMATRTGDGEGAIVRLKRAKQLDPKRHFDIIRLLGRAARQLHKKEYADQLIDATQRLALAYRRAGLLWAARASCISAMAWICIESECESELRVEIVSTVQLWAWIALELRHLPELLEAMQLLNGMLEALQLTDESKAHLTEGLADLDFAFASQILNLKGDELKQMEGLPTVFGGLSMYASQAALLYILGYEKELRDMGLVEAEDSSATCKEIFDQLAGQFKSDGPPRPAIANGPGRQTYVSRIIGITMEVTCRGTETSILVAEAVLAATEAFFATAVELAIIPHTERVTIDIREHEIIDEPNFSFNRDNMAGRFIWPAARLLSSFKSGQVERLLIEAATTIMLSTCFLKDPMAAIEALVKDEAVLDRVGITVMTGNSYHRFLSRYVSRLSDKSALTDDTFPMRDAHPQIEPKQLSNPPKAATDRASFGTISKTGLGKDHRRLAIRSIINGHLWDQAGWKGALYVSSKPGAPPMLGLMFTKGDIARTIFAEWRERFGALDKDDEIRISIVRGVSKDHAEHYVVMVGSAMPEFDDMTGIDNVIVANRIQYMHADSTANLERFLAAWRLAGRYILLPCVAPGGMSNLMPQMAIGKQKLVVKWADEVGPDDAEQMALKFPQG